MKPFNAERAIAGAPLVSRMGMPVTEFVITKFPHGRDTGDTAGSFYSGMLCELPVYPFGPILSWYANGKYQAHCESPFDLFMADAHNDESAQRAEYDPDRPRNGE